MNDDAPLIAREHALPALATVLDGARIERELRAAGHPAREARVSYVRYKPDTSTVTGVLYRDDHGRVRAAQAAAYPVRSRSKLDKLSVRPCHVLVSDPARGLVVVRDVADPRLPGIEAARRAYAGLETVVYKPGRRWVGLSRADGIVVKVHTPQGARSAIAAHRLVEAHVPTAAIVFVDEERGVVATRLLDGRALDDIPQRDAADPRREAGRVLARLHAAPVDAAADPEAAAGDFRAARRDELAVAARAVGVVAPDLGARAERIGVVAGARISAFGRATFLHGDFSADQVMVAPNGEVRIIDLDRARIGDPLSDLACWGADAIAKGSDEGLADVIAGYRAEGADAPDALLRPRIAAALLQRAVEPFRRRAAGWHGEIERILAHAERLLGDDALPGLWPALSEPGAEIVVHRRGRRAVVRVPSGDDHVFIKVVRPKRFAGVEARARRVIGMSEARTPAIVRADAELGLIRQESVGDRTLLDVGADPASDPGLVAAAWRQSARVIAELHTMDASGLDDHGDADELRAIRRALDLATDAGALADPDARLREVADALGALGARPRVLSHRDLHDKQLLLSWGATVADPGLGLIDVDTLASADPALDIANLLVHLELRVAQGLLSPQIASLARAAFTEELRADDRVGADTWVAVPAYMRATRLRLAAVYAVRDGEERAAEAMWRSSAASVNTMGG